MGAPKTSTVGGGSATGTADAFNDFLRSGLASGSFGGPNGASTGVGQAMGQTSGFGGAINSMLGGMPGDPSTYSSFFDALKNNGNGGATFNNNIAGSVFGANPGSQPVAGTGDLMHYDTDSPEFAALKHIQDMRTQQGLADTRARFSAGGGSALGSGASLAEAQYGSNANATNTLALGDLGRQMQQLDMQNRNQNGQLTAQHIQQMLQGFGMDASNSLQDQSNRNNFALGSAQAGQNMFNAQSSNQSNILQMLFGALNGANQLGTPQAQTVQTPSTFSQIMSGAGSIADFAGKLKNLANPFASSSTGANPSMIPNNPFISGGNTLNPSMMFA